ncbi:low specificity L-threonine aldolase [Salmonella enterica subsp. enterica]|nr:low specificity L-threonine aldolase [Salmonella enterica subsp. enterica serovar Enteritidis]
MIFSSDNWAGVHPAVAEALSKAADGYDSAYGSGEWDARVARRFNEIFEREVAVFFVATGTAANSLALGSLARPGGVVFCSHEAHILTDESGAPEFLSGGGNRVRPLAGPPAKIDPANLKTAIAQFEGASVHAGQPGAVSITQATEVGTVYALDEIDALAAITHEAGMPLHMDGARFANALASLDVSPADMTWRRGVDMLSFGGTKNGCWCAEAVVFFDPDRAREFPFFRMRAGQLFSKSRFVAAQFEAYLADDLWLDNARHANAMTAQLARAFAQTEASRLPWAPQANEAFPIIRKSAVERLRAAGAKFYDWPAPAHEKLAADEGMYRFVTSFATTQEDVDTLARILRA